jgi:DNA invertase Pin-like site-specific DNA recombinase
MTQPAHAEALQQEAELDQIRHQLTPAANHLATTTMARNAAADQCKLLARKAYAAGMPELHIARELRVNRRTVRRWLGKPE